MRRQNRDVLVNKVIVQEQSDFVRITAMFLVQIFLMMSLVIVIYSVKRNPGGCTLCQDKENGLKVVVVVVISVRLRQGASFVDST